jgi:small ligand-binding sensory domain FIST
MIAAGVGYSTDEETIRAARQATKMAMERAKITRADMAIIFASISHLRSYSLLLKTVEEIAGTSVLIGSSALGILTTDVEIEEGPGIAVMVIHSNRISAVPFLGRNLEGRNLEVGQEIGKTIKSASDPSSLLIILPDTFYFEPESFFQGIQEVVDYIPIVGGGSSENGTQRQTYQMCGRQSESKAVAGMLLSGDFKHTIAFSQACQPVGDPMVVTKARGNTIFELGGRPAHSVFCDLFQEPVDWEDFFQTAVSLIFLGLPVDITQTRLERGKYLVRNIIGLDPVKGSITVAAPIVEGQVVSFTLRDPRRARQDMERTLKELKKRHAEHLPAFGLYFDCCGRGTSLYGKTGVDLALFKRYLGEIPLIGFFTYAEIAPIHKTNYLHNYTGVLTLISERPDLGQERS